MKKSTLIKRYENVIKIWMQELGDGWSYEIRPQQTDSSKVFSRGMFDFQIDTVCIKNNDILIFKNENEGFIIGIGKQTARGRSLLLEIGDMISKEGLKRAVPFSLGVMTIEANRLDNMNWIKEFNPKAVLSANSDRL